MNIKELNKALTEIFESDDYFTDSELFSIAKAIRGGDSEGTIGEKEWYINAEVIGKDGNDGYITSLCQCLRDETMKGIADRIEENDIENFVELAFTPQSLDDKLSVEATAKDFPNLVEIDEDGECFWSVRYVLGTTDTEW
jgi:hypothetical protein